MPAKDLSAPVDTDLSDDVVEEVLAEAAEELEKPKPSPPSKGAVLDMRDLRNTIGNRIRDAVRDFGMDYTVFNTPEKPWTFVITFDPGGDR